MRPSVSAALCAAVLLLCAVCSSGQYAYSTSADQVTARWLANGTVPLSLPQAVFSPGCDSAYSYSFASSSATYWGGNTNSFSPTSWGVNSYNAPSGSGLRVSSWTAFTPQPQTLPTGLAGFGLFQTQPNTVVVWGGTTPNGPSGLAAANNTVYLSTNGGRNWTTVVQPHPFAPRYNFSYTSVTSAIDSNSKFGFFYGGYGPDYNFFGDSWTIDATGQANQTSLQAVTPARAGPGVVSLLNSGFGNYIMLTGGRSGNARNTSYVYLNDVWASNDLGRNFELVTAAAPWTPRYGHSVYSGQQMDMFIYGGNGAGVRFAEVQLNDLWWGQDVGASWTLLTPVSPAFAPRFSIAGCFMSAVYTAATQTSGAVLLFYHIANTAGLNIRPSNQSAVLQINYNGPPL